MRLNPPGLNLVPWLAAKCVWNLTSKMREKPVRALDEVKKVDGSNQAPS